MHMPLHLSSSVLVQYIYELQSFHLLEHPKESFELLARINTNPKQTYCNTKKLTLS